MTAFHEVAAFHGLRNITERFAPIKPAPIIAVDESQSCQVRDLRVYGIRDSEGVLIQARTWT